MKRGKQSAGLLLFRQQKSGLEVLLIHPGGPFWARKEAGAWSIPKGEFQEEDPLEAAIREFEEELGTRVAGRFLALKPIQQRGGKWVHAWALEADFDTTQLQSNTFSMEWPPRSGKMQSFPEVDRAEWFSIDHAREKILPAQLPLLEELLATLKP